MNNNNLFILRKKKSQKNNQCNNRITESQTRVKGEISCDINILHET